MNSKQDPALTSQQTQEAEVLYESLKPLMEKKLREMVQLLASKKPEQLLGKTEFELRDLLLQLGGELEQAAINQQSKKGGT